MGTSTSRPSELRGDAQRKTAWQRDDEPADLILDFPEVELRNDFRVTHGGRTETPPCGKCGCEFVNVVCPQHWPIESVALTCAKCGSVVEYIDGLLMLSVKQAIRDRHGKREFAVRRGVAFNLEYDGGLSGIGAAKELVQMGIDGGLTDQDIAEAMGVSVDYVAMIATLLK